jgi:spore maturation protein A
MVNGLWVSLFVSGFACAVVQGRVHLLTKEIFEGAATAVEVSFGLISIMVFWMGLMRIAEVAGMVANVARAIGPAVRKLFPEVPADHPAMGYILSNMAANLFGLGNAATPIGIKAMQALQTLNPNPKVATRAMCTLVAINTASITIVPTTMIAVRLHLHSAAPAAILTPTLLATGVATVVALWADRLYRLRR